MRGALTGGGIIAVLASRIKALEEEEQQIHLKAQESLQSSGKE
jgi:hypothetical protein